MDNKVNDIRRKITALRQRMLTLQDVIRGQVNNDLDCADASALLLQMRADMVALLKQRDAMGGFEACPDIAARLKENHRAAASRA